MAASDKRQIFGIREAERVDDEDLEEVLEQLDDDAEIILIKKPTKLACTDLALNPNEEGSLTVEIKNNSDQYNISCSRIPRFKRSMSLLVRNRKSEEVDETDTPSISYREIDRSRILGMCKITSAPATGVVKPELSNSLNSIKEGILSITEKIQQRYVPFGCEERKRKRKSKGKKKSKKRKLELEGDE